MEFHVLHGGGHKEGYQWLSFSLGLLLLVSVLAGTPHQIIQFVWHLERPNLGSTGAALVPPHSHPTCFNVLIRHFFFFFGGQICWNRLKSPKAGQETGRNSPNLVRFCPSKKRKMKDLLPKDLWEKKGRRRRKICYQMICEEIRRKKEKKRRRRGDVKCVDFQIEPWNVILIKQCTWVVVGLGNGASWNLPCL